jgi:hypothetical protein
VETLLFCATINDSHSSQLASMTFVNEPLRALAMQFRSYFTTLQMVKIIQTQDLTANTLSYGCNELKLLSMPRLSALPMVAVTGESISLSSASLYRALVSIIRIHIDISRQITVVDCQVDLRCLVRRAELSRRGVNN